VLSFLAQMRKVLIPRLSGVRIPDRTLCQVADVLRKASILYYQDVNTQGGTTAPVVPESAEQMRYWAFDLLVGLSSAEPTQHGLVVEDQGATRVALKSLPSLIMRFETSLRQFLDDAKLRGQLPFPR
jgi:hypothetical protein